MDELTKKKTKGPEKFEIENWADTVMRAEEIKKDPVKMKHVMPLLKNKIAALKEISSIAELKEVRQKKMEDQDDTEDME